MDASGGSFASVGCEDEVDGHLGVESVEAGQEALWIMCAGVGEWIAVFDEGSRQVQLGSVDGEGSVSVPVRVVRIVGEDFAVQVAEQVFMQSGARFADG